MMFRKLWSDEAGFIISAELVLVSTIVTIGLIVGLVVVRNQVVQELVDVGQAFGAICQSYQYPAIEGGSGKPWGTCGSSYSDLVDWCQGTQTSGQPAGGIILDGTGSAPSAEG